MNADDLLRRAGWTIGRSVDVSKDIADLTKAGFAVTPAAEAFLRENNGLEIQSEASTSPLLINGSYVARTTIVEWCEAYSAAVGSTLVPVGEYSHMVLYVDAEGGLWGAYDNVFGRGGDTLADVVQGLFLEPKWKFDRRLE